MSIRISQLPILKITQVFILMGLFVAIRVFENQLFYDPFLQYFKSESATNYPDYNSLKLYCSLLIRYLLNTIISILLLKVIFKDIYIVKFSIILYSFLLVLLLVGFYVMVNYFDESQEMILFYIRRFIIQPIFILLFIPGFYLQKVSEKN